MTPRLICCLLLVLIPSFALYAQTTSQPFDSLERAVKAERGGWAGDHSRLTAAFDSERRQLGDKFEPELLKWLGEDGEKHYWISFFLDDNNYLQGSRRLPHLAEGVSGEVKVRIVFDEEGKVIWARAVTGHPLLRAVFEDAARQSTFPPMKVRAGLRK